MIGLCGRKLGPEAATSAGHWQGSGSVQVLRLITETPLILSCSAIASEAYCKVHLNRPIRESEKPHPDEAKSFLGPAFFFSWGRFRKFCTQLQSSSSSLTISTQGCPSTYPLCLRNITSDLVPAGDHNDDFDLRLQTHNFVIMGFERGGRGGGRGGNFRGGDRGGGRGGGRGGARGGGKSLDSLHMCVAGFL